MPGHLLLRGSRASVVQIPAVGYLEAYRLTRSPPHELEGLLRSLAEDTVNDVIESVITSDAA
jgi:hypothetical protein